MVNIFSKFCNFAKDSEDFEKLVAKLFKSKQTQNVSVVFEGVEKSKTQKILKNLLKQKLVDI